MTMKRSKSKGPQKFDGARPSKKAKLPAAPPAAKDGAPTPPSQKETVDNTVENEQTWSKSKKKRMRKIMAKLRNKDGDTPPASGKSHSQLSTAATASSISEPTDVDTPDDNPASTSASRKPSMRDAFKARLAGSRFRILNEELYTTTSKESYQRFSESPELFEQYHEGFRHQVESWPENPVDVIVRSLTAQYTNRSCVVADFGCGDAQLAKDLLQVRRKEKCKGGVKKNHECPFTVHSFDLVAPNELVTACDMANVPLPDKSVDVCVFCLSLMGTNLADFIREAHRVLKDTGRVKVAEVRSRIEYSHSQQRQAKANGNDHKKKGASKQSNSSGTGNASNKSEGTLEEFVVVLGKLGFDCVKTDRSNTMFLLLELKKNGKQPDKRLEFTAKPCVYKRR
jgi:SAM-dependent methyltransferase